MAPNDAGWLSRRWQRNPSRRTELGSGEAGLLFEPLEPRLLLSADLNPLATTALAQASATVALLAQADPEAQISLAAPAVAPAGAPQASTINTTPAITGAIATPGQGAQYGFALTAPAQVYFDSLTNDGNITWSLTGPSGTVVSQRGFSGSDSNSISGSDVLPLGAGSYTITVAGNNSYTGSYAFRLLNLSAAPTVTPNTPVSDTLNPGNSTNAYQFAGTAGQSIYVQPQGGGNYVYRVIDPYGSALNNTYYYSSSGQAFTLTATGSYTLLAEGYASQATPTNINLTVYNVVNTTQALTLGQTTTNTLTAPSQVNAYSFTVGTETHAVFDALTNDSNLTYSLTGPGGTLVSARSFTSADGENTNANTLLDLVPGSYTLSVTAQNGDMPSYAFRLLDISTATPVGYGNAISGTLVAPGRQTDAYSFTGAVGDQVTVQETQNTGGIGVRLFDPYGRQILQQGLATTSPLTLTVAGTYTLLVEGDIGNAGPASFGFSLNNTGPVAVAPLTGTAITPGTAVTGTTTTSGQTDNYVFTVTAPIRLNFDPLTTPYTTSLSGSWQIDGPQGSYVSPTNFYYNQAVYLTAPGTYRLRVTGMSVGQTYSFVLQPFAAATPVSVDTTVTDSLASPGATKLYSFNGSAGDQVFLNELTNNGSLFATLYDAYGTQVFNAGFGGIGPYTLPTTGTYTLLVGGQYYNGTAASFSFQVARAVNTTAALTLGTTVSGTLAEPTQTASYTFTLGAATTLFFNSLSQQTGSWYWTLTGPSGTLVSNRPLYASYDEAVVAPAGAYTLTISAASSQTGAFSFRLSDLSTATPVSYGQVVAGTTAAAHQDAFYQFTAQAGDTVYFNTLGSSDNYQQWEVIDPFGRVIYGLQGFSPFGRQVLPYAGTYTVVVGTPYYDPATAGASFSFQISLENDTTTALAAIDGPAQVGPLSVAGPSGNALDFTGAETVSVASPAIDLRSQVSISFWINPTSLPNTWASLFAKSDGVNTNTRTYSVWLNGSGYVYLSTFDASGEQHLQTANGAVALNQWTYVTAVFDRVSGAMAIYLNGVLAASGALRTGLAVNNAGPLTIGGETEPGQLGADAYFGAMADAAVYGSALSASAVAALYASPGSIPAANLVLFLPMGDPSGSITLRDAGPNGLPVTVASTNAGLAGTVTGKLTVPGQVQRYTFTLTAAQMAVFDGLTANSSITVTITGGNGFSLSRNLYSGDSFGFGSGNPVFTLAAGSYTIAVTDSSSSPDTYAFRLLALADAQAITPGVPVSGTLADGQATQAYSFTGAVGQVVYLQTLTNSLGIGTGSVALRLIDPNGNQVFGPNSFSDVYDTTLSVAGTYTLLVEGRTGQPLPVSYSFAVLPVADRTVALSLGTNPDPGPDFVTGKIGGGVQLNGDNVVSVPDAPSLDLAGNVTLQATINPALLPSTWTAILYKGTGAASDGSGRTYSLWLRYDGAVLLSTSDPNGNQESLLTPSGAVQAGAWTEVTGVIDRTGGAMHIYVNGVDVADGTVGAGFAVASSNPLLVGGTQEQSGQFSFFQGVIDEVRVFSRALAASEVAANWNTALSGPQSGLALYLPFDDGGGTTAHDASGNGNNGVLVSFNPAGVSGQIAAPGQQVTYTFTLAQPTALFFDSQSDISGLLWSLTGPAGSVVSGRAFTGSDAERGQPSLGTLPAGSYSLTVYGSYATTGFYNFRLLRSADAATLTPGTPLAVALVPGNSAQLLTLAGTAGEKVFFDATGYNSTSSAYVRVYDPQGNDLYGAVYAGSLPGFGAKTLPTTGTYTVLVDGDVYNDADRAALSFNVQPVVATTAALTLGTAVSGTLATPGQTASYTFTLPAATLAVFDALTNNGNLVWTLTGPGGAVVSSRSFTNSDSYDQGNDALALAAGSYTLTVSAANDATGAYSFNLLTPAQASALAANTPTAVSLPAMGTALYSFSGTAGQRIDLLSLAVSGDVSWRLFDPNGNEVFGPTYLGTEQGPLTLAATGAYLLAVEARVFTNSPAAGTLVLLPLTVPAENGASSVYVAASGATPTDLGYFQAGTYTLAASGVVSLSGSLSDPNALVFNPDGTPAITITRSGWTYLNPNGSAFDQPDNTYGIGGTAFKYGELLGSLTATPAASDFFAIGYGRAVTLTSAGHIYAVVNDSYFPDNQSGYDVTITPAAMATGALTEGFDGAAGLPYALTAEGSLPGASVVPSAAPAGSHGQVLQLTQASASYQNNIIDFSATAAGPLGGIQADFDFRIAPGSNGGGLGIGALLLSTATWGTGGQTGAFGSSAGATQGLGVFLSAQANQVVLSWNSTQLTSMTAPFSLQANEWDHVTVSVTATAGGSLVTVSLTEAGGAAQAVISNYFVGGAFLDNARLSIYGLTDYRTATQQIDNVALGTTPASSAITPLPLNSTVSGSLAAAGAVARYQFTLTQATTALFDSQVNNSNMVWSLTGPAGTVVSARNFNQSDTIDLGGSPALHLAAGTYILTVSGNNGVTGAASNYVFSLDDLAAATPVSFTGGVAKVSGTLNPGDASAAFSFSGTAGQVLSVSGVSGSTGYQYYQLLDPSGNQVFSGVSLANDAGPVTLAAGGTYTLLVEGRVYAGAAADPFSLTLNQVSNIAQAISANTAVSGSFTTPGQTATFTLALTHATELYFDQQSSDYDLVYTLTGPDGVQLFSVRANSGDQGPYAASAGTYTLTVSHTGDDHLGGWQFQFLDPVAAATAVTPGTAVSGTLTPGNGAVAYSFAGTAGQSLYFDAVSSSQSVYWTLVDPAGNQLFSTSFTAQGARTLALSGTYTLLIEGYVGNTSPATYTFNVQPVATTTQALTLGALVNGSIGTAGASNLYTFTLAAPAGVVLAALSDSINNAYPYDRQLGWTITGPSGQVASSAFNASEGTVRGSSSPVVKLAAGSYTLAISASTDATGTYSFRLLNLAAATALTPGTPVTGTLSPASSTVAYSFAGTAGATYDFTETSYSGGNLTWRLVDPNNNVVFFNGFTSSPGKVTLPVNGTYVLLLEGYLGDTGTASYGFGVYPVAATSPVPITPGSGVNAPDLQVTGLAVAAAGGGAIQSGGTINVSWTDSNTGTAATDASWTDSVVVTDVTTGQIIATQLLSYDAGALGALAAGAGYARSLGIALPAGAAGAGQIKVVVTTDSGSTVSEGNAAGTAFSNNTASATVTSALASYPDLQVSGVSVSPAPGYAAGATVTVSWTLTNAGSAAVAVAFNELVQVTNTVTGDTIALQSDAVAAGFAAGASAVRSLSFTWPGGLDSTGQFTATVTADSTGAVTEAVPPGNRTDNAATATFVSAPDLLVQSGSLKVTNTAALQSGDTVTLAWTDANAGDAGAPVTWNDVVSVVNTATGQTLVNQAVDAGGPLAAGGSRARSFSFQLPNGAAGAGALQIAVAVDPARSVIEAVTGGANPYGNNTSQIAATSTLRLYPDLVTTATAPATGVGGGSITVGWTVSNNGPVVTAAGSWIDQVVLSPTATLGAAGNVVLGSFAHSGDLAAGASYSVSQPVTLPANLQGTFYVFVVADSGQAVLEPTGRADATSTGQPVAVATPAAALDVSNVSAPAQASSSGSVLVTWTVTNNGTGTTNVSTWVDRIYLSQSTTAPGAGDPLLGSFTHVGALAVGGSYAGSLTVALPGNVFGTGYHLLVVTDADGQVFRAGQTAGGVGASGPVTLLSPDLVVTTVTAPGAVQPGQAETVSWTVADNGTGDAPGGWTDRLYFSPTGNFADAVAIGDAAHAGGLAAGASYTQSLQFTMPTVADGVAGKFFVVADVFRQVVEANGETDNRSGSAPVAVIHPDLATSAVTAPASGVSSQAVTVGWTVTNTGTAALPAGASWTDQVYVASGTGLDGTQRFLGSVVESGPLAVGASYAGSLTVTLPADLLPGSYHIVVLTNAANTVNEAGGTANNVAASGVIAVSQPALPDLQIQNLAIGPANAAGNLTSSEAVTISWSAFNNGGGPVANSFYSRVVAINTATGATLLDQQVYYDIAAGPIAAGGSAAQRATLTLPNGAAGVGAIRVTVTADSFGQVYEGSGPRTDNVATATRNSVLQAYPDLVVNGLNVGPASPHSGDTLTIGWTTSNTGAAAVTTAFHDEVIVTNQSTGVVVADQSLTYDPGASGAIAGGAGVLRSTTVTLPQGTAGVGTILVKVIADAGNNVTEATVPHTDNTATVQTTATLNAYPDLQVTNIVAPASASAGATVTLSYTVANAGTGTASGSWAEQVYLSPDGKLADAVAVQGVSETGQSIAPGGSVQRTAQVTLPPTLQGTQYVLVTADSLGSLVQLNQVSHTGVSAATLQIMPGLTLSFTATTVADNAGSVAFSGVVMRSGDTSSALTVALAADASGLVLPASVVIAAGQSAQAFQVGAVDSLVVGPTVNIDVTATAAGYSSSTASVAETNSNVPTLTLTAPAMIDRNAGTLNVVLTRNTPADQPLTVNLTSDLTFLVAPPATATFSAGQSSITVGLPLVDDGTIYGNLNVRLNASAAGFSAASATVLVNDTDVPTLSLALGQNTVSEAAGINATTLTITRSVVTSQALNLALGSMAKMVTLSSSATIPGGQASVTVPVGVVDNGMPSSESSSVGITVVAADPSLGKPIRGTAQQTSITVTGSVGPNLSTTVASPTVIGGGQVTATVTRGGGADTSQAVTVMLSSSNTGEATVPATVVIAAGQASATYTITGVNDGSLNSQTAVTITATAPGYAAGYQGITVSNQNLPNLAVTSITNTASLVSGQSGSVTYTVVNNGKHDTTTSWVDSVYLSNSPLLNKDAVLIGTVQNSTLAAGASYSDTLSFPTTAPGTYYVVVVADSGGAMAVINPGDEHKTGPQAVTVTPAYTVSVQVASPASKIAPAGTAIGLSGTATDAVTGQPDPFKLVTITVTNAGFQRTLQAVTDPHGNYLVFFHPVGNESGSYSVTAAQPGAAQPATQDTFSLLGLTASASTVTIAGLPGQAIQGSFTITDTAAVPLTKLQAALSASLPATATLSIAVIPDIAANGTVTVNYTFTSTAPITGNATLTITSAEGAKIGVAFNVSVLPLTPALVANPGYLNTGMVVGTQQQVSFTVTNTGGAESGALQVELPAGVPWLGLVSAATIPSIAPGATATVTLQLTPDASLALQEYQGSIVLAGNTTSLTVPFQIRATSSATGTVTVTAQDESTYFAANTPNLAGATITLQDPYTYAVVATGTTGSDGTITFTGVDAGPYLLVATAPNHATVQTAVTVAPGTTNSFTEFLHFQAVSYTWAVVPTQVADHYQITLQSTFQTAVPMPIVTVDMPFVMPLVLPGVISTINLTFTNHGLIDAKDLQIQVPTDPDFIITPLVNQVDVLPAGASITIPVQIQFNPASSLLQAMEAGGATQAAVDASQLANRLSPQGAAGYGAAIAKCFGLDAIYTYDCATAQWVQTPISMDTIGCLDSAYGALGAIAQVGGKAYLNSPNLLTADCAVLDAVIGCLTANNSWSPGVSTLADCAQAILVAACGYATEGPLGALSAGGSDILTCLCDLAKLFGGSGGGSVDGGDDGGFGGGGGYGVSAGNPYLVPVGYTVPAAPCGPTASDATTVDGASTADMTMAGGESVCAQVVVQLSQQAVVTRTDFVGTLDVMNGMAGSDITDLSVTLNITDMMGNDADDMFDVQGPALSGFGGAAGSLTLTGGANGSLVYTFIPTVDAAMAEPMMYFIGGTLHYVQDGETFDVPLAAAPITVYPEAQLNLSYFWQRNVIGDDPFTPQVEPSEPYYLGLRVTNVGAGAAGDLTITSSQPKIVENEKGLLVNFQIIGSEVQNQPGTDSLTVGLGTIAPGQTVTADWELLSSLQGRFTNFSATFQHEDDGGSLRTSLIKSVTVAPLIQLVHVGDDGDTAQPSDNGVASFLVENVASYTTDGDAIPDTLYIGDQSGSQPVTDVTGATWTAAGGDSYTLSFTPTAGWDYVDIADPAPGDALVKVVRSDGAELTPGDTVWRTDRVFPPTIPGALDINLLHLLDFGSTGSYTFYFVNDDGKPPVITAIQDLGTAVLSAPVPSIDVTFSKALDLSTFTAAAVALTRNGTAVPLAGLTFADEGPAAGGGETYRIGGLAALTDVAGNYVLTVDGTAVRDVAEEAGNNALSTAFNVSFGQTLVTSISPVTPTLRSTPADTVTVTFSAPVSNFTAGALSLARNGAAVTLGALVTAVPLSPTSWQVAGLSNYDGADGSYVLTVNGALATDANGQALAGAVSTAWTVSTVAPAVTLAPISPNPRNTIVQSLEVTTNVPVDPASFDYHAITVTQNGGPNIATSAVTVTQVDATHFLITNFNNAFNAATGINGTYTISVDATKLRSVAGVAGTAAGDATETWVLNVSAPPAATNLHISPDNGVSNSDGITDTLAFTLLGNVGSAADTVRFTDLTNNTELGYATVASDGSFSGAVALIGPGAHTIRVRVIDTAGNTADATLAVFIDTTAPTISAFTQPSTPTTAPVDAVDFTLSKAINDSTFTTNAIGLTLNGNAVALSGLTLTDMGGNMWAVAGLSAFDAAAGTYVLTISVTGLQDNAGNSGTGSLGTTWTETSVAGRTGFGGTVFNDTNGDGTQDNGETGLAGWTVYLDTAMVGHYAAGDPTTTTDGAGHYEFDSLSPGMYAVMVQPMAGWISSGAAEYMPTVAAGVFNAASDNFGEFQLGRIAGTVFDDANADGVRGSGETGRAGVTVYLDAGDGSFHAGDATTTTDTAGGFSFTGLGAGTYKVGEVLAAGLQATTATAATRVQSGTNASGLLLGDVKLGSISGAVFEDANGNGARDPGEAGLSGWTVFIDARHDGQADAGDPTTVTDANGNFTFSNLVPGSYTIGEVLQPGYVETSPLASTATQGSTVGIGVSDVPVVLDSQSAGAGLGPQSLADAASLTGLTAALANPAYAGLDGSGETTVVIDTGLNDDPAWFGPNTVAYQYDFADNTTSVTDTLGHGSDVASVIASDNAADPGVAPGARLVILKVFDSQGQGYFSDVAEALQWVAGNAATYGIGVVNMSLGDGGNWTTDASRYGLGGVLSQIASEDVIVVAAAGNNYVSGQTIGLAYPGADPSVLAVGSVWPGNLGGPWRYTDGAATTTTAADQIAAYSQRDPNLPYELAPGGVFEGPTAAGGTDAEQGTSQASAYLAGAATLAQQLANQVLGHNLSLVQFESLLAASSDPVVDSPNAANNVAASGATYQRLDFLKLFDAIEAMGATGTVPGTVPGTPTTTGTGGPTPAAAAATGEAQVALAEGQAATGVSFGDFKTGTIFGTVFSDPGRTGVLAAGDAGVGGVTVFLDLAGTGSLATGDLSTVTDANGHYSFIGLTAGTFTVRAVLPGGDVQTTAVPAITVTSGLLATANIGLASGSGPAPGTISGTVFRDLNGDGQLEAGEPGIAGRTVFIDAAGTGSYVASDPSQVTDSMGHYSFTGLAAGSHVVREVLTADVAETSADPLTLTVAAGGTATANFGLQYKGPSLTVSGPQTALAGATYTLSLSAADPLHTVAEWFIDWGDGTIQGVTGTPATVTHSFAATGAGATYTIQAAAQDDTGLYHAAPLQVTVAPALEVTAVTPNADGVSIRFNGPIDALLFHIYDATGAGHTTLLAADLTLTGAVTGAVAGSVVFDSDGQGLTFIKTGGPLAADTYTLDLLSGSTGVLSATAGAGSLDGLATGLPGSGDYTTQFTVAPVTGPVLSLPDFIRGPGQAATYAVNAAGIPVSITGAAGLTDITFHLTYDPALLTVTGASGSGLTFVGASAGVATFRYSGAPIGGGTVVLGQILGTVPATALYGERTVLKLTVDSVAGGGLAPADVVADNALQVVGFLGDTDGNAAYGANDATLIQRVIVQLDSGFAAWPDVDPVVVADVARAGRLATIDATRVNQEAAGVNRPEFPALPAAPVTVNSTIEVTGLAPAAPQSMAASVAAIPIFVDPSIELTLDALFPDFSIGDLGGTASWKKDFLISHARSISVPAA